MGEIADRYKKNYVETNLEEKDTIKFAHTSVKTYINYKSFKFVNTSIEAKNDLTDLYKEINTIPTRLIGDFSIVENKKSYEIENINLSIEYIGSTSTLSRINLLVILIDVSKYFNDGYGNFHQ